MRRVFNAGEVSVMPTAPGDAGYAGGYFDAGDPLAPREATAVPAWWLNLVQETILSPILSAGLAASVSDVSQLTSAIRKLAVPEMSATMPGGIVFAGGLSLQWAAAPSPTGWDPADEGERAYTVSWFRPFTTTCLAAWCQAQLQTDTLKADIGYNLIAMTKTDVTVRRNRPTNASDGTLDQLTRALIFGVGI